MDEIINLIDKSNLDSNSLNLIINNCNNKLNKLKVAKCCELLKTKSNYDGIVELITDFNFEFKRMGYKVNNLYEFVMGNILCQKMYNGDNEGYGETLWEIRIDDTTVFAFESEDFEDYELDDHKLSKYVEDKKKLLKFTKSIKMNYKQFIINIINILDELCNSKYYNIYEKKN